MVMAKYTALGTMARSFSSSSAKYDLSEKKENESSVLYRIVGCVLLELYPHFDWSRVDLADYLGVRAYTLKYWEEKAGIADAMPVRRPKVRMNANVNQRRGKIMRFFLKENPVAFIEAMKDIKPLTQRDKKIILRPGDILQAAIEAEYPNK